MTAPTIEQIKTYAAKTAKFIMPDYPHDEKALHTYRAADGVPLYWRVRVKTHATIPDDKKAKAIRPFFWNGADFKMTEPPIPPEGKTLYGLERLAALPDVLVIIVEGENKVDALDKAAKQWGKDNEFVSITSGGAPSAGAANWQPCAGRHVYIFRDNDGIGVKYAADVVEALCGIAASVAVLDISPLNLKIKGDAVDWLADGGDFDGLMLLIDATRTSNVSSGSDTAQGLQSDSEQLGRDSSHPIEQDEATTLPDALERADEEGKRSQASELVAYIQSRAELFHDKNKDVFATDNETGETRRLESRAFKDWLLAGFYQTTGKSARDQSLREALGTLAGLGRHSGEEYAVYIRVAGSGGVYYVDLAEPERNRVVKIEAGRWEITSNAPVRFIRTESMQPLPEPQQGGDIAALWQIANIQGADRMLVLAWLCECLRPDTPFPVLELLGEQGSAKSTAQTALRRMIDPNSCNLRGAPKAVEDVFVSAGVNWLVSFENISHLTCPMQDAMCVLATGGGFAKRKLYSDADETVIKVNRPIVLNGISASITAQDLIDRTLTIETPVITARVEVGDLWKQFEDNHGSLFGALLDIMAKALQILPTINLAPEDRPRLVEFVRFGMAIAEASGTRGADFLNHFNEARKESIARTIDASPVASALLDWFDARDKREAKMTCKDILAELERFRPQGTDAWPRSGKGLSDAMRRAAPALRTLDIECRSLGKMGGSGYWLITKRGGKSSLPSPASPEVQDAAQITAINQDIRTCRTLIEPLSPAHLKSCDIAPGEKGSSPASPTASHLRI